MPGAALRRQRHFVAAPDPEEDGREHERAPVGVRRHRLAAAGCVVGGVRTLTIGAYTPGALCVMGARRMSIAIHASTTSHKARHIQTLRRVPQPAFRGPIAFLVVGILAPFDC